MKYFLTLLFFAAIGLSTSFAQVSAIPTLDPWTKKDLIEARDLAAQLSNKKTKKPAIFNIGVVENLPGARATGGVSKSDNLSLFKKELSQLKRDQAIVIYCGCCPFERCPNIRPAFNELKASGFTNFKLLNLPTNLKQDWIAKGYPLAR